MYGLHVIEELLTTQKLGRRYEINICNVYNPLKFFMLYSTTFQALYFAVGFRIEVHVDVCLR